jgi:hypothetical protein
VHGVYSRIRGELNAQHRRPTLCRAVEFFPERTGLATAATCPLPSKSIRCFTLIVLCTTKFRDCTPYLGEAEPRAMLEYADSPSAFTARTRKAARWPLLASESLYSVVPAATLAILFHAPRPSHQSSSLGVESGPRFLSYGPGNLHESSAALP